MYCNYHICSDEVPKVNSKDCIICLELGAIKEVSKDGSYRSASLRDNGEDRETFRKVQSINIFNVFTKNPNFQKLKESVLDQRTKVIFRIITGIALISVLLVYFKAVFLHKTHLGKYDYWCNDDGLLILITIFTGTFVIYYKVLKPFCGEYVFKLLLPHYKKCEKLLYNRNVIRALTFVYFGLLIAVIGFEASSDSFKLIPVFGEIVFISLAMLFSLCPLEINLKDILWCFGSHLLLGFAAVRLPLGSNLFSCVAGKASHFLSYAEEGLIFATNFYLPPLLFYIFKILSVTLFYGMVISVLEHFHIIQWLVEKVGWIFKKFFGTSHVEGLAVFINVFVGQGLTPIAIGPYISNLTKSEIHTIMTSANTATSIAFTSFYSTSYGINPSRLFGASVMGIPASILMSKIFYPETKERKTNYDELRKQRSGNIIYSVVKGTKTSFSVATILVSLILVTIESIVLINSIGDWACYIVGFDEGTCHIQRLLGYGLYPFAWLIGIPNEDCSVASSLLASKLVDSEFFALKNLSSAFQNGFLSRRSYEILIFAISGFASFVSMGLQVGIFGVYAPCRMRDVASLSFRSLIAGNMAAYLTASTSAFFLGR